MDTQEIWHTYGQEAFFHILKRVKDNHIAHDILQNSFLKIHKNIHQLKAENKLKAWVFQICRNEIANYYNEQAVHTTTDVAGLEDSTDTFIDVCCFDKFVNELPKDYKEAITLTYIHGKKQHEVAEMLDISLANVKARIRRSKTLLKQRFHECCKFEIDPNGNLSGPSDCASCA